MKWQEKFLASSLSFPSLAAKASDMTGQEMLAHWGL